MVCLDDDGCGIANDVRNVLYGFEVDLDVLSKTPCGFVRVENEIYERE